MGYLFGGRQRVHTGRVAAKMNLKSQRRAARWVEIRPSAVQLTKDGTRNLGFGVTDANARSAGVRLPRFLIADMGRVFASLGTLLSSVPEISSLEMDFLRLDLAEEWSIPMEKSLHLHSIANQAVDLALGKPSVAEAFLALWLSRRSGWQVGVRARVQSNEEIPVAPLEMLGRDLFHCECEVTELARMAPDDGVIDLSCSFPCGWPFPAILPTSDSTESLTAQRLHNPSLPNLPKSGLVIGVAETAKIHLPIESRDRHTYIVGATGTGKSTLLGRMIVEDMKRGDGVILLDPHGDLFRAVKDAVPAKRRKDLFIIDPSDDTNLPGLNVLDIPHSRFKRRHATFLVGELFRFFEEVWNMRDAGGPVFEMYFRNTILLMCLCEPLPTKPVPASSDDSRDHLIAVLKGRRKQLDAPVPNLGDFTRVMADDEFRQSLLKRCPEKSVVQFWKEVAERTTGDYRLANFIPYIASKLNSLVQAGFLADMLCSKRNDLRIGERMDRGQIILVNLNKGLLGSHESRLLGTILIMEIFAAGLARSAQPESKRRPVNVYVDEFQNFVSDNVAAMLSEARKFGLRLTLANQTLAQLNANPGRQNLLEAVLGNVGNMILFRLGVPDADRLRMFLAPFSPEEMQELPNFHALARLLTAEGPVRPLIMQTLPG